MVLRLSTCCGKIHNPDDSMVPWYSYMQSSLGGAGGRGGRGGAAVN